MIDRFNKAAFEAALPKGSSGEGKLWHSLGLIGGEHCYIVPVREGVLIYVRSTVRADGIAADRAKDSIRCWLASNTKGAPLGSKDTRWIARTVNWRTRLIDTLRLLWRMGTKLDSCSQCNVTLLALKCKNGDNKGKWFRKCPQCKEFAGWINAPTAKSA